MAVPRKLTDEDVLLIRELGKERVELRKRLKAVSLASVAEKFGVTTSTIFDIQSYETHRKVR